MPTPRKKPATDKPAAAKKAPAKKAAPKKTAAKPDDGDGAPYSSGGKGNFDLVVVESPAKAKTINKYLGPNFRVLASYGHVRDLDTSKKKGDGVNGIDIANGWKLRYVVDDGSGDEGKGKRFRSARQILDEIGREAARADRVLLASDPDREGESIAWHIADELDLPDAKTFRITFNEITKNAVTNAVANPKKIDRLRVDAQEARRAMDRVVGFPLSNLLGKKVAARLSAGRVQSVAVKLIVDRERQIEDFKTEEYWKITALLAKAGAGVAWTADLAKSKIFAKKKDAPKKAVEWHAPTDEDTQGDDEPVVDTETSDATPEDGDSAKPPAAEKDGIPAPPANAFLAELARWDGAPPNLGNEAQADAVVAALAGVQYVVTKVEKKSRQDRPLPPFTTSTLQQQANARMKFSASRTMQTAQKLYEGIELAGMGQTALITYMRTDSVLVSNDALAAVRTYISNAAGFLGPRYLPTAPNTYKQTKGAQAGHEAIRPTDVNLTPKQAQAAGLGGDQLRLYTLIWQRFVASQCVPAEMDVTTYEITAGRGLFRASGRVITFDGHRKVLPSAGKDEDTTLPQVNEKDVLNRLDLFESQHFTQPPPRFNEGSLVKALEKEGIGRPSTYASIISTIQKRGYVTQDRGRFYATEIGKVVTDLLVKHFPNIMSLQFTSGFEEKLDKIEEGETNYEGVLNEFWTPFSKDLKAADTEMESARFVTDETCPKCGKRPLEKRFTAKTGGYFLGCTGWKDKEAPCSYKQDSSGKEIEGPAVTDIVCPACGKFMVKKTGRFGVFYTCEGAPDCPTTMNESADGKISVTALPTAHPCPRCEKLNVLVKESKAGKKYVQCPDAKCGFISDCDADGKPVKPADTGINCEKCGKPMIIKTSWRGPFLACTGFPKCRGSKSINAELKEKLKDILPPEQPKTEKKKDPVLALEISDECPQCGAPLKLLKSRFGPGYYLACTKGPGCKGNKKVSPDLQARIDEAAKGATS